MVANPTIGFFLNAYIFLELFILPSNTIYKDCIAFTIVSTEKAGTLLYFKILILNTLPTRSSCSNLFYSFFKLCPHHNV